jgi:RimJ/RimL family protein N-acetyltransferase
MTIDETYLFQSERLGFRNWSTADIEIMSEINADPKVMEFFPSTQTREQTINFIERMQKQFAEKGFCYFAVDKLEDRQLIGFIGINTQTFESDFTPCNDIGWRLKSSEWNKGYATEGAKRCLAYAFGELGIEKIYSIAPKVNLKSERIMLNLGMKKIKHFIFPLLKGDKRLEECVLYEISGKNNNG